MKKYQLIIIIAIMSSCSLRNNKSDAYGNFEATEITVSAESTGKITALNITEGELINPGFIACIIDSSDWVLKKEQLIAQKTAVLSKAENISAQVEVQKQQKENLLIDKKRIENLLKAQAATQKQYDDLDGNLKLIDKQINTIQTQFTALNNEAEVINKQITQINETILKCKIKNPVQGTVLNKYAELGEIAITGKALYKIADLTKMYLKVYVDANLLANLKTGQQVEVLTDDGKDKLKKLKGTISWISQSAEFTPKIIQTKEERVNLVYALKILVDNDGTLKIGMPGEVNFAFK